MDNFILLAPDANIINLLDTSTGVKKLKKKLEEKIEQSYEMDGQRWKPVPGFESSYRISDHGYIYSTHKSGIMKPYFNKKLRKLSINLNKGSVKITRAIDRLVANAFLPNYRKGCIIRHMDNNVTNNHYKNLFIKEKKLTIKKRLNKIKKDQELKIILRLQPSYSGVKRKMKDGSYKIYHYNYFRVDFREKGKEVFQRVFTTKEKARNFYLMKKKEYNAKYPAFRKKNKKA